MTAAHTTRRRCRLHDWPAGAAPIDRTSRARECTCEIHRPTAEHHGQERVHELRSTTEGRRVSRAQVVDGDRHVTQSRNRSERVQHRVVDKHLARQRNRWLQARGRHARRTPVRVDFALIFISRICTPPFAQRFFWHIAAATVSGTAPQHNRIRSLASSSKSLRKYTESQPEVWTTLPVNASSV